MYLQHLRQLCSRDKGTVAHRVGVPQFVAFDL
jgi:hypothetical protein